MSIKTKKLDEIFIGNCSFCNSGVWVSKEDAETNIMKTDTTHFCDDECSELFKSYR